MASSDAASGVGATSAPPTTTSESSTGQTPSTTSAAVVTTTAGLPAVGSTVPATDDERSGVVDAAEGADPNDRIDEARRRYPPEVAALVLRGRVDPPGFIACVVPGSIGGERFGGLRNGAAPTVGELDAAATCLLQLDAVIEVSGGDPNAPDGGERPSDRPPEEVDTEQVDLDEARRRFPPGLTGSVLRGRTMVPSGFEDCIIPRIGGDRLGALRDGGTAAGQEHDAAAICLEVVGADPTALDQPSTGGPDVGSGSSQGGGAQGGQNQRGDDQSGEDFTVAYPGVPYRTASGTTSGSFRHGQPFDLTLSAIGFDQTGGPLLFNRPSGLSSDGTRLVMADTFNNRVLVWNDLPTGNVEPDLVLGQDHFGSNEPGTGLDRMNWPVATATADGRLLVADTQNDRILVWTTFPTRSGQPADLVMETPDGADKEAVGLEWPWGVWTDGRRVVATSTMGGRVLVWNTFPTRDRQVPDFVLTGDGRLGTPRQVTSDGTFLMVGDHNAAALSPSGPGTFVWSEFPTTAQDRYDYFLTDPIENLGGTWLRGDSTDDGRLLTMGSTLYVWDGPPGTTEDQPVLVMPGQGTDDGFDYGWSDFSSLVEVDGRVWITTNRNTVVGFDAIPTSKSQRPDFVIGSDSLLANTMVENHILSNPVPASNGTNLFVTSDFDKKLLVWRSIPDESGAPPDLVYHLCGYRNDDARDRNMCQGQLGPWDNALHGDRFAIAGKTRLMVWEQLPLEGDMPERDYRDGIGSVAFRELMGVALDDRYLYLADKEEGRVWVWEGLPGADDDPVATLRVDKPTRLHSDGTHLVVTSTLNSRVTVFRVDDLADGVPRGVVSGSFNLPQGAFLHGGGLYVADTGHNQVEVWDRLDDALSGQVADVVLGATAANSYQPELKRDRFFWPGAVAHDGTYLWVGEFKFSGRLLRLSPGR